MGIECTICSENQLNDPSSKNFQSGSSGTGAMTEIVSFEVGCSNDNFRAWRQMEPSLLDRFAPYFKSPLMMQPISPS